MIRVLSIVVTIAGLLPAGAALAQTPCPDNFVAFRGTLAPLACACSVDAVDRGTVYGMDVYTDDSSVCKAAVHAGVVPPQGGDVIVMPGPGKDAYAGVTRNGISSSNWGQMDGSFSFASASESAPAASPDQPASVVPPSALAKLCPDNFVAYREAAQPLTCGCIDTAIERGSVYGMDVYTEDSGVCRAALHAGVIPQSGGNVTVIAALGQKSYPGVTRNGISSSNWGAMDGSFRFEPVAASAPPATIPPMAEPPATAAVCPDNFVAFRDTASPLTCGCSETATELGSVYGMDIYTEDSNICRAAMHAGFISPKGGNITVVPAPGQKSYAGVTRNGISSSNWGEIDGSFQFAPVTGVATAPAIPAGPKSASTVCPDDFVAYRGTETPLVCSCSPEATEIGSVYGMDMYTDDSGVCKAAVHAGVLGPDGGNVTVRAAPGEKAYAGVTRNGIRSSNWGVSPGSFQFVAEVASLVPVEPPVPEQKPIAAALEQTGEVQLYVNFANDSAKLSDDSGAILDELLGVLRSDPNLRLSLIGHTDSIGSADYNMKLSEKRAESVKLWLLQRGVLTSRIQTDGRGASEPLDDNSTEFGRAVNRRVQALRAT